MYRIKVTANYKYNFWSKKKQSKYFKFGVKMSLVESAIEWKSLEVDGIFN